MALCKKKRIRGKRVLSSLFIAVSAAISVSGQAGENITYEGDETQLKSIKGENNSFGPSQQSVSNNKVTINFTNGTPITGSIFGGYNPGASDINITGNRIDYVAGLPPSLNSNIFGGYSDAMGAVNNNKVVIVGNYDANAGKIAGGFSAGGGRVSDNQVAITWTTVNSTILGGESNNGNVDNNQVLINILSTINGNIFGGRSLQGASNVSDNQVIIENSSRVLGNSTIVGGSSQTGNVSNNQVSLNNSQINTLGDIQGGFSKVGNVSNNQVNITNIDANNAPFFTTDIIGGQSSDNGNVNNNTVIFQNNPNTTVRPIRINETLIGGKSIGEGRVFGNQLSIIDTGWLSVVDIIAAGSSNNGNADNNQLMIKNSKVTATDVSGAITNTGSASNNRVIIDNSGLDLGSLTGAKVSGLSTTGNVSNNQVTITNIDTNSYMFFSKDIIGGESDSSGSVDNNTVIFQNNLNTFDSPIDINQDLISGKNTGDGRVFDNQLFIIDTAIGGSEIAAGNSNSGNADNNQVMIKNSKIISGDVSAAITGTGLASNNHLVIDNSTLIDDFSSVIGAKVTGDGNSASNIVTILNDSIIESNVDVYGAKHESGGTAEDNQVILNGGTVKGNIIAVEGATTATNNSINLIKGTVEGTVSGGVGTNRTLYITAFQGSVGGVENIDNYEFVLSNNLVSAAQLTIADGGDAADLASRKVTLQAVEAGEHIYQVSDTLTLINQTSSATQAEFEGSEVRQGLLLAYDFERVNVDDSLQVTVTDVGAAPDSKALSEGQLASFAFVGQQAEDKASLFL